jgi:hypothetical protein
MSTQSVGSISNANYANFTTITKGFDSPPFFGAGIGYTFNSWFRADATPNIAARPISTA